MATVEQKTVLLGVTGCIAAYKACEIVRGLQKAGVRVKVVMTQNATRFVGSATFKALTREPVAVSLFDAPGDPIHHISLAKEADLFLVAPCTANVMAKLAHGVADDLLTTTALATQAPLLVAPAMNTAMWEALATRENLSTLASRGIECISPASGRLACGDEGEGKLAEVDTIVSRTLEALQRIEDLEGKRVLITAGPTYEPIDPVRFLGNYSSGKTGYALAEAAARRGAQVTLVSGPTSLANPHGVTTVHVQTAHEMLEACKGPFKQADIAIFSAAVADYAPAEKGRDKLKKIDGVLESIALVENPDILATLAATKGTTLVVGFAAETRSVLDYAQGKLRSKNADLIVANDVSGDTGFGSDDNKAWLVSDSGVRELELMSKRALADCILDECLQLGS